MFTNTLSLKGEDFCATTERKNGGGRDVLLDVLLDRDELVAAGAKRNFRGHLELLVWSRYQDF